MKYFILSVLTMGTFNFSYADQYKLKATVIDSVCNKFEHAGTMPVYVRCMELAKFQDTFDKLAVGVCDAYMGFKPEDTIACLETIQYRFYPSEELTYCLENKFKNFDQLRSCLGSKGRKMELTSHYPNWVKLKAQDAIAELDKNNLGNVREILLDLLVTK